MGQSASRIGMGAQTSVTLSEGRISADRVVIDPASVGSCSFGERFAKPFFTSERT